MKDDSVEIGGVRFYTGDYVTCRISGAPIDDARIYVCSDKERDTITESTSFKAIIIILLNGKISGLPGYKLPEDQMGYKGHWAGGVFKDVNIGGGRLISDTITDLKLVNQDIFANIVSLSFSRKD